MLDKQIYPNESLRLTLQTIAKVIHCYEQIFHGADAEDFNTQLFAFREKIVIASNKNPAELVAQTHSFFKCMLIGMVKELQDQSFLKERDVYGFLATLDKHLTILRQSTSLSSLDPERMIELFKMMRMISDDHYGTTSVAIYHPTEKVHRAKKIRQTRFPAIAEGLEHINPDVLYKQKAQLTTELEIQYHSLTHEIEALIKHIKSPMLLRELHDIKHLINTEISIFNDNKLNSKSDLVSPQGQLREDVQIKQSLLDILKRLFAKVIVIKSQHQLLVDQQHEYKKQFSVMRMLAEKNIELISLYAEPYYKDYAGATLAGWKTSIEANLDQLLMYSVEINQARMDYIGSDFNKFIAEIDAKSESLKETYLASHAECIEEYNDLKKFFLFLKNLNCDVALTLSDLDESLQQLEEIKKQNIAADFRSMLPRLATIQTKLNVIKTQATTLRLRIYRRQESPEMHLLEELMQCIAHKILAIAQKDAQDSRLPQLQTMHMEIDKVKNQYETLQIKRSACISKTFDVFQSQFDDANLKRLTNEVSNPFLSFVKDLVEKLAKFCRGKVYSPMFLASKTERDIRIKAKNFSSELHRLSPAAKTKSHRQHPFENELPKRSL